MSKITFETVDVPRTVIDRRKVYTFQFTEQEVYFLKWALGIIGERYGGDGERLRKLVALIPSITSGSIGSDLYKPENMFNKE